jgi:hypothetical protein
MGRRTQEPEVLQEVLTMMGAGSGFERPPTTPVSLDRLRRWMASPDIRVLGAAYVFLDDPRHSARIDPPLDFEEDYEFTKKYYERCFRENPEGDWTNNRYEAGWDLVNWFAALWKDRSVPRPALSGLKQWLADLYRDGDAGLRRCLVDATLEHLFEQPQVRKFFDDWKGDPVLTVAHAEALAWVKGGGKTPLGKPEGFRLLRGQMQRRGKRGGRV